jgi:3-oxoacyl-[acyl-carrier protein] reductase
VTQTSTFGLKQKVVLVTGGSRGIGKAIVESFAEYGSKVYFTYCSSEDKAKSLVSSLQKKFEVSCFKCDVKDSEQVEAVFQAILDKEDRLDILVNNAGIVKDGLFLTLQDKDWTDVLDTNLGGVYRFCKLVAQQMMMQQSGRIINISSIVGELGGFGQANYAASKGAINAFTKALAAELASKGVTVNAVAPGMVDTEMTGAVRSIFGDKIKARIPVGYFAKCKDIASLVCYLASDEASYITGQIVTVDGGISLLGRR